MPKINKKVRVSAANVALVGPIDTPQSEPPESPAYIDADDDFGMPSDDMTSALSTATEEGQIEGLSPVAMRLLQAATDMKQSPDSYERAFLARQLIQGT